VPLAVPLNVSAFADRAVHYLHWIGAERGGERPVPGSSLPLCKSRFIFSPRAGTERRGTGLVHRLVR
jgi:hypothetical protein